MYLEQERSQMDIYAFQYCQKIVVLSSDGSSVLLCRRKGEADYDGTFSFIGGKMEITDASILEGLHREKDEEVGKSFKIRIAPAFSTNALFRKKDGNSMILPHYLAYHLEGKVELSEEYSEHRWVRLDNLNAFEPKIENIPQTVQSLLRLRNVLSDADFVEI